MVTVKDFGLDDIVTEMRSLKNMKVKVGLFAEDRSADGSMNMAELGTLQEFGNGTIPARPFMGTTIEQYYDEIGDIMVDEVGKILDNHNTANWALDEVGRSYVGFTQQTIEDITEPKNAQYTIDRKGGVDNPLIETGKMKNSVKHKITGKRR